ncbi:chemotaxis protein CheA [Leptospira ognonensis]|uniref:Chemotaxis protein CheA n=1 Tax=Leptospira ognonensis TaxID=2484945 RepID=A0A4R9JXU8_9LEPT|nr:chemotaxis protein CheA [Leptospira ognonensis]TGL57332.1 chemotaxis protein CheA [Leptospira ognonensis]
MDLSEVIDAYVIESTELLGEMENILLEMEKKAPSEDDLNALFRAVHTIKGTSGMFGFDQTVKFTHKVENLLDDVRSGKVKFTKTLTDLLLKAKDHIDYLVVAEPKQNVTEARILIGKEILEGIQPFLSESTQETIPILTKEVKAATEPTLGEAGFPNYLISFRPKKNVFQSGLDPFSFINYLKKLGKIISLKTITSEFPKIEEFQPEDNYLGFEIHFQSSSDLEAVRKVFDFIEGDSFLHILPPGAEVPDLVYLAGQLPEEEIYLGNLWKYLGILNEQTLVEYLKILAGELESEKSDTSNEIVNSAKSQIVPEPSLVQGKSETKGATLKVDSKRVDVLINRVGELVVASANLNQSVSGKNDSALQESALLVSRLLNEVREISLKLRMVPIGDVLQKYQRIVRDLGNDLSKQINLHIDGKETELDRNIVDKLGDPLVHIIRNACDHGLETAEERTKKGKTKAGNLWINAYHDTGSVVIEIKDDGRGIQSDIVWKKAVERGIVSGPKPESPEEIYKLLFHAGFSTAHSVTNVSGRGVGLDVVQKSIESLRGTVQIQSEPDKGSTFQIRLPLTLAIIEGFLVGVGSSYYILPMEMVLECLEFDKKPTDNQNQYFPLRGSLVPYIRMRDIFLNEERKENVRENIVIVRTGDKKAGIVVERLYGEFQTVIKPMGSVFQNVKGVSGSSILADGKVALIIDLPSLFERTVNIEKNKTLIK